MVIDNSNFKSVYLLKVRREALGFSAYSYPSIFVPRGLIDIPTQVHFGKKNKNKQQQQQQ